MWERGFSIIFTQTLIVSTSLVSHPSYKHLNLLYKTHVKMRVAGEGWQNGAAHGHGDFLFISAWLSVFLVVGLLLFSTHHKSFSFFSSSLSSLVLNKYNIFFFLHDDRQRRRFIISFLLLRASSRELWMNLSRWHHLHSMSKSSSFVHFLSEVMETIFGQLFISQSLSLAKLLSFVLLFCFVFWVDLGRLLLLIMRRQSLLLARESRGVVHLPNGQLKFCFCAIYTFSLVFPSRCSRLMMILSWCCFFIFCFWRWLLLYRQIAWIQIYAIALLLTVSCCLHIFVESHHGNVWLRGSFEFSRVTVEIQLWEKQF